MGMPNNRIQRGTNIKIDGVKGIVEDISLPIYGVSDIQIIVHIWFPDGHEGDEHKIVNGHWLKMKFGAGSASID